MCNSRYEFDLANPYTDWSTYNNYSTHSPTLSWSYYILHAYVYYVNNLNHFLYTDADSWVIGLGAWSHKPSTVLMLLEHLENSKTHTYLQIIMKVSKLCTNVVLYGCTFCLPHTYFWYAKYFRVRCLFGYTCTHVLCIWVHNYHLVRFWYWLGLTHHIYS